jgi:hypothetical protein
MLSIIKHKGGRQSNGHPGGCLSVGLLGLAGLALAGIVAAGPAHAATARPALNTRPVIVATVVTGRPDSGDQGNNWADDDFLAGLTERVTAQVPLSDCGGTSSTGACYHVVATLRDSGTFTTIPGQLAPGTGGLNGGPVPQLAEAITGPMAGTVRYDFYSTWKTLNKGLAETQEADGGALPTGTQRTAMWPAQMFGKQARFYVAGAEQTRAAGSLETGFFSFTYTAAASSDSSCPLASSAWTDSSALGASGAAGNILAPAAPSC